MNELELAEYIIQYFEETLTPNEVEALVHHRTMEKLGTPGVDMSEEEWEERRQQYIGNGLVSNDPEVLHLLENGYEHFLVRVKQRVLRESPEKVFFKVCPSCDRPARSPHATTCSYCGHVWEDPRTA